jgi:hypothetical protein
LLANTVKERGIRNNSNGRVESGIGFRLHVKLRVCLGL